ncbi:pyruvate, phosphate dikinase [Mycobacterium sp. MYCO198283]|uniref:pyruvate, phosphate dikinase n=1 Tax=Mycobacterium sp. MYCO198283 TaxID=2883505 RepID=UPI001E2CA520|nr:pyruvate, phosphate dikinase [Mycobacterium sp. MYCO198283]MCG5433962.1 pyruvate, phosphate dikinase [Mycobacterium sp. MYCO198283]
MEPDVTPVASAVVLLSGHGALDRELVGGKAYGIDVMAHHGLPVPPAFCLTTEVCRRFFADPRRTLDALWADVRAALGWLEHRTGRTFGSGPRPLLVSVRSGAAHSMPGMLDTVLNVGVDDAVHAALTATAGREFADDVRARAMRHPVGAAGGPPEVQLRDAIAAVFASWHSPRAAAYRRHHGIDDGGGTAVVVQAMVFGNLNGRSGAGVLFTRNPITGDNTPYGEWLRGGQGEDLVSGTTDGEPIGALAAAQPEVHRQLLTAAAAVERRERDVADIEFTVEDGRLWLLQTRRARRSARAAVRLALALHAEGIIGDAEALRRVTPEHVRALLPAAASSPRCTAAPLLASGLPACPGVVSGRAYTDVDAAIDAADDGEDVILVRRHTSPQDVQGMLAARGLVTEVGGATSHAAVVSRELGRPAVVGCGTGAAAALAGRLVTVDGTRGEVRDGAADPGPGSPGDAAALRALAQLARTVAARDGDDAVRDLLAELAAAG